MKKVIFVLTLLISSFSAFSQTPEKNILENIQNKFEASIKSIKARDYVKASNLLDSTIITFNKLSDKEKEGLASFLGLVYYNKACCQSILNNKEEALDNLENAVKYQWNNYKHTLKDQDLDNIRDEQQFKKLIAEMKKTGDFLQILKDAAPYNDELPNNQISFTYQPASDPYLARIRQHFNLDSIAGKGDEISQIKNLMKWVHNRVRHDGNSSNPESRNAIDIVNICDTEKRGVNCRMMAIMLNECYLAMGFKSRYITCMPQIMISDCHVINAVYSKSLNKWLWMDPTFNAYISDDRGNLLSIAEVRERLRSDEPLVLNEDANWNNENKQTKEYYIDTYMAKNLYWLQANLNNTYNVETTRDTKGYLNLYPQNYEPKQKPSDFITTNDKFFWEE